MHEYVDKMTNAVSGLLLAAAALPMAKHRARPRVMRNFALGCYRIAAGTALSRHNEMQN